MAVTAHRGATPRLRIEAEAARRGREELVAGCCRLVEGDDGDHALILALGGPHARHVLAGGPRADQRYWLRVWAVRGLLWVWDDQALDAVVTVARDPAWRVREMAAKVVAWHHLGDLFPVMIQLRDDPVPRVRAAATRAIATLTRAGA